MKLSKSLLSIIFVGRWAEKKSYYSWSDILRSSNWKDLIISRLGMPKPVCALLSLTNLFKMVSAISVCPVPMWSSSWAICWSDLLVLKRVETKRFDIVHHKLYWTNYPVQHFNCFQGFLRGFFVLIQGKLAFFRQSFGNWSFGVHCP